MRKKTIGSVRILDSLANLYVSNDLDTTFWFDNICVTFENNTMQFTTLCYSNYVCKLLQTVKKNIMDITRENPKHSFEVDNASLLLLQNLYLSSSFNQAANS